MILPSTDSLSRRQCFDFGHVGIRHLPVEFENDKGFLLEHIVYQAPPDPRGGAEGAKVLVCSQSAGADEVP